MSREVLDDAQAERKRPGPKGKTGSGSVEAEFIAGALITVFLLISQLRPEPLRPSWTLTDEELDALVPPITRWLNRQPARVVKQINDYADPAMAAAAFGGIILSRLSAEQQYSAELRRSRIAAIGGGLPSAGSAQSGGAPIGGTPFNGSRLVNDNGSTHLRNS